MDELFLDKQHEIRFFSMMQESHTPVTDSERRALFYIISGNEDLFQSRYSIYDFHGGMSGRGCLKLDCFDTVDLTSGTSRLLRLAFNLFNNYSDDCCTPYHLFSGLDSTNFTLACQALIVRFQLD